MNIHISLKTIGLTTMIVAVFGAAGTAQLLRGHALVEKQRLPGLLRVPTCEEAGVCRGKQRLLVASNNAQVLERLQKSGCKIRHALEQDTSVECPTGVSASGARKERAFRAQDLYSMRQIHADVAMQVAGVAGGGVRVAILDTGVDAAHPELGGRIVLQENFTTFGTADAAGHGTHVAGIASGQGIATLDGNTVAGVAPQADIIVGKVCGDDGWCLESDILAGMEWAQQQGARVVNMSLGGGSFGSTCDTDTLAKKANSLVDHGVVVVAAAGNNGAGVGAPACGSKVIAVGAVDSGDVRATWSSMGQSLDVVAPGVKILSSYSCAAAGSCNQSWYAFMSGTSMASPHVTGIVALLLSAYPTLTPAQVTDVLTKSALDRGAEGWDTEYGWGRVDAARALELAKELMQPACPDADGDGVTTCNNDCNDNDALVLPGMPERCNGIDDNCNGRIDDNCQFGGVCGDKRCESGESAKTCPRDCRGGKKQERSAGQQNATSVWRESVCGNGVCEGLESERTCARDCGSVAPARAVEQSGGNAAVTTEGRSNGSGKGNGSGNSNNGGASGKAKGRAN